MQYSRPLRAILRPDNRRCLFSSKFATQFPCYKFLVANFFSELTFLLPALRELQGPRSGFGARLVPFARIHVSKAAQQETGTITKQEGKQYECIQATVVGDGTVGLVTLDRPKALNALSHALMVEVVDALQSFDASLQVCVP